MFCLPAPELDRISVRVRARDLAVPCFGVICVRLEVDEVPRAMSRGPLGKTLIVLREARSGFFADSDIEFAGGRRPENVQEIGFVGDARHGEEKGRSPGLRPCESRMVAGVRFELTTFGL